MSIINNRKKNTGVHDSVTLRGNKRSFAVAEAHKRLRTNVLFSFSNESGCRVIGVTSSMMHEGKSTTSINLAYDMLQAGKKVLLIDADMRLSNFENTLELSRSPGLSNFLVGDNSGEGLIQHSAAMGNLSVITCGDIPPNPTELLSSKRMKALIDTLKSEFSYIIIDCPPISAVSDALIISRLTDGMIMVVRQEYADKQLLDDSFNQLKLNGANIIGFVVTCATQEHKYYGSKYKRYGYYKYGYHNSKESGK